MPLSALNSFNYSYDPYFMAAYQSYNPSFQALPTQAVKQQPNTDAQAQTQTNPAFKGKTQEKDDESTSAANLIIGIASAAAMIYGGYKCHGKGVGDGVFAKVTDGFKKYWNEGIDIVSKWKFENKIS